MVIRCLFIVEQQQLMNIGMLLVINQSETTSARLMLYRRTLAKMQAADTPDVQSLQEMRKPYTIHKTFT